MRYFASVREALGPGEDVEVERRRDRRRAARRADRARRPRTPRRSAATAAARALDQALCDERRPRRATAPRSASSRRSPAAERGRRRAARRRSSSRSDFDLGAEVAALRAGDAGVGAVAAFVGTVRDRNDGRGVASMELEHYPGMTERAIEAMIDDALRRFEIRAARVVHRVGVLQPLDADRARRRRPSAHRGEAFQACEFLMDYLKTQAPFWKKETTADGRALGRRARRRRRRAGALGHRRRQRAARCGRRAPRRATVPLACQIARASSAGAAARLRCCAGAPGSG